MTRIAAALTLTLLITACICSPAMVWGASSDPAGGPHSRAQDILLKMIQAQENLTSFEGTAEAKVYIGGRNVLTTSVGLIIERPNHVAVKWFGMTIRPRHGLIFVDPQIFVSNDYTLSVLSAPAESSRDASSRSERWVISAVSSGSSRPQLSWVLYVEPDTWLIRRAQVTMGATDRTTGTAGVGAAVGAGVGVATGTASAGGETAIIEADYRQAGYRRWEPVRLSAQGRMVLEEFLPNFLVNIVAGRGSRSTSDAVSGSAPFVLLEFGASRPGAPMRGQSK